MSDKYYRNTVLDVNLAAVEKNYRAIQGINPEKTLIAVVKANAYGLGAKEISEHLAKAGVSFLQSQHWTKQSISVCTALNRKY